MRLATLITLNWGNLQNREWAFPDMTLLTGETGSGKSTLLDAIQTVLTSTYAGVFFYNPGQEETTQTSRKKEKRTLPDYCLGREGTQLARTSAHTYIACVFEPSPEENTGQTFTAIVAVEAIAVGNRAEQTRLGLFLARNHALTISDFLRDTPTVDKQTHVVDVREFWPHLQRKFGREAVGYFGDDKGDYLRALYGAFRSQSHVPESEALRAARAVVKAMAYKPVGSIDDLVKGELLDEQDLSEDLRKVGDLLRDIRELSDEAERLDRNIGRLEQAQREGEATLAALADQLVQDAAAAKRAVIRDEEDLARRRTEANQALAAQTGTAVAAADVAKRMASHNLNANALRAKLAQIPAWNEQERLEAAIADAERIGATHADRIAQFLGAVAALVEWGRKVDAFMTQELSTELQAAQSVVRDALGSARRFSAARLAAAIHALPEHRFPVEQTTSLTKDAEALAQPAGRLFDALLRDETSFSAACSGEAARLQAELNDLKNEDERLVATLRRLESGRSAVPPGTAKAFAAITIRIPHAKAQILAELVETKPGTVWQNALEGFMGNDRFAIVVEESAEREAVELLRSEFARDRAKIIQGRRAKRDALHRELPSDSIVEELVIAHPTASAYMRAAYGNVIKVANSEALRDVSRGLTAQGHAASGYSMFAAWMPDEQLALGHEARERARRSAELDLRALRQNVEKKNAEMRELRAVAASLRNLALPAAQSEFGDFTRCAAARAEAVAALSRLDLTESKALQVALEAAETELGRLDIERTTLLAASKNYENTARERAEQADALETALPEKRAISANRFTRFITLEECASHRVQAHELGGHAEVLAADRSMSEQAFANTLRSASTRMAAEYGSFVGTLGEYNANAREPERLPFERERLSIDEFERSVPWLALLLTEIERQLKLQRDIGIAQNRERLKDAEGRFNHVFTSDFCFKIHSRVNAGVSALRELNRELEHLTFGSDRFTLDWTWVPEFEEYYRFFAAVHDQAEDFGQTSIFDDGALAAELTKVRDTLKTLLLDKNRELADKRLKELADYRNYRHYEIWRQSANGSRVALSTWGTGSGGQLETPFYIVRSAVLSSALRFFTKEGSHLRLMLSDEAFSKMDESRRRSVIRYLRQALGVQFIVAMPTSNSGSVKPEFDKEFTFAQVPAVLVDGREWMASEAQEKELKPAAMKVLWEAARTEAATRAREEFFAKNPDERAELKGRD